MRPWVNWSPTQGYKKQITSGYNYRALTRKRRPSVGLVAFVGCRSWRPVYDCNLLHWFHKKKALSWRVCEVSFLNVLAKCKYLPILNNKNRVKVRARHGHITSRSMTFCVSFVDLCCAAKTRSLKVKRYVLLPACRCLLFPLLHAEKGRLCNAVTNRVPASRWVPKILGTRCDRLTQS